MIICDGAGLKFELNIEPTEADVHEVLELCLKDANKSEGLASAVNKFMTSEAYKVFKLRLTSENLITQESFDREFNDLCASEDAKNLSKVIDKFHEENKILRRKLKDILDNKNQNKLEMFLCAVMGVSEPHFDCKDIIGNFSYLSGLQLDRFSNDILVKVGEQLDSKNITVH